MVRASSSSLTFNRIRIAKIYAQYTLHCHACRWHLRVSQNLPYVVNPGNAVGVVVTMVLFGVLLLNSCSTTNSLAVGPFNPHRSSTVLPPLQLKNLPGCDYL